MTYQERASRVAGVVLWQRRVQFSSGWSRIMPDGCLDLIWDGGRLFVAGPDSAARWHCSPAGATYTALRFSGGIGPAFLGVPADALCDRVADLGDLWPSRPARVLADQVAADPVLSLETWVVERAATSTVDPFGGRVLAMATSGLPPAMMADQLSLSPRQLHRRCLPAFGYGPRRLTRVVRFGRALKAIRAGSPLAQVAAGCGYADQAHLTREVNDLAGTTPGQLRRRE